MGATTIVPVHICFGCSIKAATKVVTIEVAADGSDSILAVKEKISAASEGGSIPPEQIQISFGPNSRKIGKQFFLDPNSDESLQKLGEWSVLAWVERFPHWHLSAKLMPEKPLPPGVAIKRAAAMAEGQDPDAAVRDAIRKGEILKDHQLPPPWGNKPYTAPKEVAATYAAPKYPVNSVPSIDVD